MLIGICGKSGSGKSTIAKNICEFKTDCIHCDVDKIGHECLNLIEVKKKLKLAFGQEILKNGLVDRKKLGQLVFTSKDNMKILTDITWIYMENSLDKIIEENKENNIVLDWILLPMTKYFNMCDIKVLIDIPYEVRKQRAMKRDNITEDKFNEREQASINYNSDEFDLVIANDDLKNIRKLVKCI